MSSTLKPPNEVRTVAVVGSGVIGIGWILHFLRMGLQVRAYDPAPSARARISEIVAMSWPIMEELGLREGASIDKLVIADTLADAVSTADVVQEAAPEDVAIKAKLFAEIDELAPAHAVLLTSTSGISMTLIQAQCDLPGRTATGHPFNPPYLIPLVEVLGGEKTDPEVVEWTMEFYRTFDKYPVFLEREVPAFIASRLQEAMWREALHMIAAGEATVEMIDDCITEGPGLRWVVTGPMMNFHLAGGPEGMKHVLDHFGPTLKEPWTRLVAPELTDQLREAVIEGCDRESAGRTVDEMVLDRDRAIIAIMKARREAAEAAATRRDH
ncbi:MAG TPA: 3-hydroxyacyl-CoA dehydrogenase NAD-binding domain-containing protein [Candidatus Saccharimonadales bacterium]|nr:3-hydroxyacyl-CoA dehydrogenase NAD-binding domain-containing protein [Candidatus Saccharimonadales bacterium]